jgi:hypothetical protein
MHGAVMFFSPGNAASALNSTSHCQTTSSKQDVPFSVSSTSGGEVTSQLFSPPGYPVITKSSIVFIIIFHVEWKLDEKLSPFLSVMKGMLEKKG